MSVVWNSRFQKHHSQRILQNEVRETPSVPVRRVRKDVLFDERHALPTVSNIEELLSMWSSLSESRVSAFPRFPGSKGLLHRTDVVAVYMHAGLQRHFDEF